MNAKCSRRAGMLFAAAAFSSPSGSSRLQPHPPQVVAAANVVPAGPSWYNFGDPGPGLDSDPLELCSSSISADLPCVPNKQKDHSNAPENSSC